MESEKRDKKIFFLLLFLTIIQLIIGIFSVSKEITPDGGMHSLIADLYNLKLFRYNYEPITDVELTYPPLFHLFVAFFNIFYNNSFFNVKLLGIIIFSLFPIGFYFLGKIFDEKVGILAALFSVLNQNFVILMLFSGYPQLLSFLIFLFFLSLFYKGNKFMAGFFLGMAILSHPFMALFSVFFYSIMVFIELIFKKVTKETFYVGIIAVIISSFWLKNTIKFFCNMLFGRWNNTRWYSFNPGIISLSDIFSFLFFRLNILIFLFSFFTVFSIIYLISVKKKEPTQIKKIGKGSYSFLIFYLICLFFTLYHYPPAQYKFLDLFTIPVIIFSAIGSSMVFYIFPKFKKRLVLLLILTSLFSIILPIHAVYYYQSNFSSLSFEMKEAAVWLRDYDKNRSRIIVTYDSSNLVYSRKYNNEAVFSAIAEKYPMDMGLSDLEVSSFFYKKQQEDREKIIKGEWELLSEYNIKYIISSFQQGCKEKEVVYNQDNILICKN